MNAEHSILLACDNTWLASSVCSLLYSAGGHNVRICTLMDVDAVAQQAQPDVIVVFSGVSPLDHADKLNQLRTAQPDARIILTIALNRNLYESHPFIARFDALLDESEINRELLPLVQRMLA